MSTGDKSDNFEPLPMKRRVLSITDANQYCIREASGKTREIKANTAYEAFRKCGQKNIIKIERIFNLNQNIISGLKFEPSVSAGASDADILAGASIQERIRTRRNPIISADELDELMRAVHKEDSAVDQGENQKAYFEVKSPVDDASPQDVTSPVGLDVHGDGFDEIIPAKINTKFQDNKEMSQSTIAFEEVLPSSPEDSTLPPARELSAEEVIKLLEGE